MSAAEDVARCAAVLGIPEDRAKELLEANGGDLQTVVEKHCADSGGGAGIPTQSSEGLLEAQGLSPDSAEAALLLEEAERLQADDYAKEPEYYSRVAEVLRAAQPDEAAPEEVDDGLPRAMSSSCGEQKAAADAAVAASLRYKRKGRRAPGRASAARSDPQPQPAPAAQPAPSSGKGRRPSKGGKGGGKGGRKGGGKGGVDLLLQQLQEPAVDDLERAVRRGAALKASECQFRVGQKVRVRAGVTPRYGWGKVKPGDVGTIRSISDDKKDCKIAFPCQPRLWNAHLPDMEAAEEPEADSVPAPEGKWSCPACTFFNSEGERNCEMCGTKNPAPPPGQAPLKDIRETVDLQKLLGALDEYDRQLNRVIDEDTARLKGDIPALKPADQELAVAAFDHMMRRFEEEVYRGRYGWEGEQEPLQFGEPVPSYFANVHDSSIHRRKVLSMAGLRNLIKYGPEIYREFEKHLFKGGQHNYPPKEGLSKMRYFTGNVVDLDTTVLRASDRTTLDAINMMNKKQKEKIWKNSQEFSSSKQAEKIAVTAATELCERFAQAFDLSEKQQKERKIHPSQMGSPLPLAQSHEDRGKWPLWHYVNAGQDSFHANVPTMPDVNGALLRAPFHCVRYYCLLHFLYQGAELQGRMESFFEDCVADTCFNQKWKSIEEFGAKLAHEGTIVDVLQRIQKDNQQEFSKILDIDDEEGTKEKARMWELAQGKAGKDREGSIRPITKEDVERWVDDPSIVI
eukprot:TRINITY_DN1988_c0_g2_i1.p1 TRINITY_DN1988_c0_g2~~TRINITY_DN1988_c0_g2_i1.p1  ORF type:complete len:739 (+),score=263.21 TRINITY_DN1988_c0_g2_i1:104-2320(+)